MKINGLKVLVVKISYIGDTISIIPVVENIKDKAPEVTLDVMVNRGTEELLAFHPNIRKVYAYDRELAKSGFMKSLSYHTKLFKILRSEKYDVIIDFTLGDRSSFISFMTSAPTRVSYKCSTKISHLLMTHLIDVNPFNYHIVDFQLQALRFFGFSDFHRTGEIHIPDDLQTKIDHWLNLSSVTGESLNVAIHPGARKKTRQWRPERFGEIAQRLRNKYSARIILIGGPGESNLVDKVEDHMGSKASIKTTSLSLLEMAALLKRCHLFLGNDTAPGHIAGAVKCSTITMFGPNFPHLWSPISPSGDVLFKNLPCCGCRHEEKLCIRPENNCMDMITVDEVWEKTENLLHRLFHLHT